MELPSAKSVITLVTLVGCTATEAAITQRHLGEADAAYPEGLATARTVRPLPDGRLLVGDPLGQVLLAIDMEAGRADTIGRPGTGPGEYEQPDAVFELPGDSTLLLDLANGRLTVLGPTLEAGETMPLAFGDPQGGDMTFILPSGVDGQGRLYFQGMGIKFGGPGLAEFPDSAPIMRFDRGTKTIDTLGMVLLRRRDAVTSGLGGSLSVDEYALAPEDAWHVGADGRVAVARTDPYYVEWIDDDGRQRGPQVQYTRVPVRRADREAWVDEWLAMSMMLQVSVTNGVRSTSFARGAPTNDPPGPEDFLWPDEMPPFAANGVRVSPEGDAWVRRSTPTGDDVVYDVFDADGVRTEQVVLPPERRVVGFGGEFVYAVWRDEFDLVWLERFERF